MRYRPGFCATLAIVFLLLCTSSASAWSHKEHILFTRLAALRLMDRGDTPPEMREWLRDAMGDVPDLAADEDFFLHTHIGIKPSGIFGLCYWAYVPDERALYDTAVTKIEPFGVHEKFLHYLDLELFISGDDRKREYKHDLSNKPKLSEIPRDMKDPRFIQAGMLPFRTEQCFNELVSAIRAGRLSATTRREQENRTAIYWAGYLSHYLADATQPHHATMDYKSQSYFADKRKSPNVHAELEYRMCDDEVNEYPDLRKQYWPLLMKRLDDFVDPAQTEDVWQSSLETTWRSYDALPLIGLAAMKAAGQGGTPEHPTGPTTAPSFDTEAFFHFKGTYSGTEMTVMEMKAIQTAWAVKRIERTLRQAWQTASKNPPAPTPRGPTPRGPTPPGPTTREGSVPR